MYHANHPLMESSSGELPCSPPLKCCCCKKENIPLCFKLQTCCHHLCASCFSSINASRCCNPYLICPVLSCSNKNESSWEVLDGAGGEELGNYNENIKLLKNIKFFLKRRKLCYKTKFLTVFLKSKP